MVTVTGAGTCTLKAQQAGDATYAPAPEQEVQFEVLKKMQTISWGNDGASQAQFVDMQPFALAATATSGLPVVYQSQGVCTVNGAILALTGQPGDCHLVAEQAGNADTFRRLR